MSSVSIRFKLPEETEDLDVALNGWKYKSAIESIWDNLFRPKYKHGYLNEEINKLLENEDCYRLLSLLEELYRDSVNESIGD